MEDRRLSRIYVALLIERLAWLRDRVWRGAVMRSGMLTTIVLGIGLLTVAFIVKERGRGHLAKLKTELKKGAPTYNPVAPRPGGQDAILLQRSQLTEGTAPEFRSAMVLPGCGMQVLQLTAYLPQKGEVQMLASPSLDEAARLFRTAAKDAERDVSLAMGGAVEVPWAGRITGVATDDGLATMWRGDRLNLPLDMRDRGSNSGGVAIGGLLLRRGADAVSTAVMPDGGEAQAFFKAGDFDGRWLSKTEITTTVQLSSRMLEMKIVALNTGGDAEPIGIGWGPKFAIVSGDREHEVLRMPNALRVEIRDRRSGLPTGRLLPVEGTPYDFTGRNGAPLGSVDLDDTFVHLRQGLLDNGPAVELRDPANNYGLRVTAMGAGIKAMRIQAPTGGGFVSIQPQLNYDDPFGREWPKDEDTGMVILQPGQSVQWKIRVEIFALTTGEAQHL